MRRSALMCRGYSCVRALRHFGGHFAVDTDALPSLKIEQTPDAVAMIPFVCAMLGKQLADCLFAKQPAVKRSLFKQHLLQIVELGTSQPICPGGGEAHFLPVNDVAG